MNKLFKASVFIVLSLVMVQTITTSLRPTVIISSTNDGGTKGNGSV